MCLKFLTDLDLSFEQRTVDLTCLYLQFNFSQLDGRTWQCLYAPSNCTCHSNVSVADVIPCCPIFIQVSFCRLVDAEEDRVQ